jgi:Leucyl aminopeptidase
MLAAERGQKARTIHLVDKQSFESWLKGRPAEDRSLLEAHRFDGKTSLAFTILPRGGDFEVVSAVKNSSELGPWCLAKLAESLPESTYRLASGEPGKAMIGWLLAQHRFDDYRSKKVETERGPCVLLTGEAARIDGTVRLAEATALVRDLVNTPAAISGPRNWRRPPAPRPSAARCSSE